MSDSCKGVLLIVDDEPSRCAGLKAELSQAGYEVLEATDPENGLRHLGLRRVDAVLTDLRSDGLQVLDTVRSRCPQIPVIMMTTSPNVDSAVRAIKHGAHDYLSRPFPTQKLLQSLQELFGTENGREMGPDCTPPVSRPVSEVASTAPGMPRLDNWPDGAAGLTETVAGVERTLIDAALKKAAGNQAKAAQFLGIPRTTLRDKMAKYGMVNTVAKH